MRRGGLSAVLVAVVCAYVCLAGVTDAFADTSSPPPYDGGMGFPAIPDPSGPEEFSWEVELSGDQELRQADERHAEVVYGASEVTAFGITAGDAHDATGAEVATTLVVSEGDIITLVVHHRAGNPLTGQPFVYPVVSGRGFERGFESSTFWVDMPPPNPAEAPKEETTPRAPRKGEIGGSPAFRLGPPDEGIRTSPQLVIGTGATIDGRAEIVAYGWKPDADSPSTGFCIWVEILQLHETDSGHCGPPIEPAQSGPIAIDMDIGFIGPKPKQVTAIGGQVSSDVAAVRLYFHRPGSRKSHHLDAIVGQVNGDLQHRLKQPAPFGYFYARLRGLIGLKALYAQALDANGNVIGRAHGLAGQVAQ